jgi:hypothetical protein
MISKIGPAKVMMISAACYLLSAVLMLYIDMPKAITNQRTHKVYKDLRAGLHLICGSKILLVIIVMSFLLDFIVGGPLTIAFPVYMKDIGRGAQGYRLLLSCATAGAIMSGIIVSALDNKLRDVYGVFVGLLGLLMTLLSWTIFPSFFGILFGGVIFGVAAGMLNIYIKVIIQKTVPAHFLGRIFGWYNSLSDIGDPVSMIIFGYCVAFVSMTDIYIVSALLSAIILITWILTIRTVGV